ncbi:uncharacterized protein LTHEOB_3958 [Neofusicoccum parvum]|uniref:Uncharacterized protein LTHEOB_3958 n=1 Tax=Neofusicoccum parvum TaxID=310453 RepID=A0ACB5RS95_9PEZI|nr:uncharacterized protein LTHEOB_3958 [Neofusicoccum parvum]
MNKINAARYAPTVGIVTLGFACKAVASDAKKITPWSSMTRKWSKSSRSVALDYITRLEVLSIIPAARRRHWAVFTGLVVGFLCGALVAVANALTYTDLFASSSSPATFSKATGLGFDGTLENPANQSLTISYTYLGQKPYAAVAAEKLPNGQAGPWTKDSYVFESFTNTSQLPENATIEAPTRAFHSDFNCHPITWKQGESDYNLYFQADTSSQPELNCALDLQMQWGKGYDMNRKAIGWLNVTACDEEGTDLRLVSTLGLRTNITKPGDKDEEFNTTLVGVMWYVQLYYMDPFTTSLTEDQAALNVESYLDNPQLFKAAVERQSTSIMAQVVNVLARSNASVNVDGELWISGPKMFLRQTALRALQASLLLIAIICLLQTTLFRPKTILQEDPGSIASRAVILASSAKKVERIFSREAVSSVEHMQHSLSSKVWRLQPSANGSVMLEATKQDQHGPINPVPSNSHDGSVQTMAPYKSLWKGSKGKKQPLLFNLRDAYSILLPFHAIRNGLGFAVAASSFVILVIPAIKIVAAGLYNVQLVQTTHNIQPLVDLSIVDHLQDTFSLPIDTENTIDYEGKNLTLDLTANIQTASQFTEWAMNPDFNIPVQSGILENLVFSNLTSIGDFDAEDEDISTGEITVNVPAIAVDVTCKTATMGLIANWENSTCAEPYFDFYFYCDNAACNQTMNVTESDYYTQYLSGSSQSPCTNATNRFKGLTFQRYDLGYQVLLGDFGPITTYLKNNTFVNETGQTVVESGMFNTTTLPNIRAAVCYTNLTRVTVDTTFARKSSSSTTNTTLPSWNPIRFDRATLARGARYANAPYWISPLAKTTAWGHYDQYDASMDTPGMLDSGSLWPTRGSSTSFFELLASHSTYALGNLSAVLDGPAFAAAAEAVCAAYATNMLTQLRPWARSAAGGNAAPEAALDGVVAFPQARIAQDWPSTVALEVCLGVMVCCLVWVAVRFPSEAVLPKNPGSVAATASLVAGSALVGRLREEGVGKVGETRVWGEGRAGLGWWPVGESAGEGEGSGEDEFEEAEGWRGKERARWGVDVGEGVVRQSWREPPGRMEAE